jgi:NAD(P)-dependent dehydrogenase (short-subunit alcohol dehydrogenase family)
MIALGKSGRPHNPAKPGLRATRWRSTRARHAGKSRAEVAAMRDAHVPPRKKIGTAWHVADAASFLASDAANFITGVALPADGGTLVKIG